MATQNHWNVYEMNCECHYGIPVTTLCHNHIDNSYHGNHHEYHEGSHEEMIDYFTPREVAIKRGKDKLKG